MRITENEYLTALQVVKDYKNQIDIEMNEVIDDDILNINIKEFINPMGVGAIAQYICDNDKDPRFERFIGMYSYSAKRFICLRDLLKISEYDLMRQRHFGKKTLDEIKNFLSKHNLKLKLN